METLHQQAEAQMNAMIRYGMWMMGTPQGLGILQAGEAREEEENRLAVLFNIMIDNAKE
jgi:hypothetical protein